MYARMHARMYVPVLYTHVCMCRHVYVHMNLYVCTYAIVARNMRVLKHPGCARFLCRDRTPRMLLPYAPWKPFRNQSFERLTFSWVDQTQTLSAESHMISECQATSV